MATATLDPPTSTSAARRHSRRAQSPPIPGRELAWVAVAGVALAILTSWPLAAHMSSRISPDLGDPVRTAWEVAWVGHAMLNDPGHLFDSNAFYPHPLSLAFSDSLLGYGPTAWFGSGTVAALVRYNLLFLWAWSLCFVGAYLLARELGLGRLGAGAAGIAFAYAPYRVTEAGHLHVISSGGIPLALVLLLRGYRRSSRGLVLAGWLVGAWQISLGFTLGLQFAYLLVALAAIVVWEWWRGRRRLGPGSEDGVRGSLAESASTTPATTDIATPTTDATPTDIATPHIHTHARAHARGRGPLIPRRLVAVTCVGMAVMGAVTVYQARPYLKVAEEYPTAKRTLKEVENYSSGPAALLAASSENRVWGGITSGMRAKVHSENEDVFWPGGLILVLALVGLATPVLTGRMRIGLVAGIVVCSVLAMGMGLTGAGYPYRLLYDYAPGWDGVRVPGRVFTLATLAYALLAGAGVAWLVGRAQAWYARRGSTRSPRRATAATTATAIADYTTPETTTSDTTLDTTLPSDTTLDTTIPSDTAPDSRRTRPRAARPRATRTRTGVSGAALGVGTAVGVVLMIGLLGEGAGHLGHPVVPQPAKAEIGLPGPVLDLPTDGALDRVWQYYSTDGFYEIPVGNSTFDIPAVDDLRGGMAGFPDRASVEKLRYYKIKTVVLHTVPPKGLPPEHGAVLPEPPDPAAAAAKPIAGLGIAERRVGSIVIYEIGPGPAALHGTDHERA